MDVFLAFTLSVTALLAAAVAWLVFTIRRRQPDSSLQLQALMDSLKAELLANQMQGLVAVHESLDSAGRGLNDRLAEGTSTLDRRLKVISEIENKLGRLQQQTTQIEEIGRNIQGLSDLLKPPKLRGGLGELLLENLLAQILPPALYAMQHCFRDGRRVDAIIRLGDRLLPIDSKFPLDAFQRLQAGIEDEQSNREFRRAIKGQIDSICNKYILPGENTTDFAVMYIPSEAVYYRLISESGSDLFAYALAHRIIPSSPSHLYAFLASVAAIYTEAGLAGNTRRLTAVLNALRASVDRLDHILGRMTGSARMLGLNLDKARAETEDMVQQLVSLGESSETVLAAQYPPEEKT